MLGSSEWFLRISRARFVLSVSINHTPPIVSLMFMSFPHETNAGATRAGHDKICVICLPCAHPIALSSPAPLLIGELLNNSAVSDVKRRALIHGKHGNVGSLLFSKRREPLKKNSMCIKNKHGAFREEGGGSAQYSHCVSLHVHRNGSTVSKVAASQSCVCCS